ncbi:poly-beta-1,6-N-acetyl-D-glucosamine biosynthesis protein PgaD [Coralloluteibacterium stylophorae]|uniref:Poly-beta-1,6-N-acetyl-D-glucosamine biosynthesis protein PgaD n=1 Tax=Coralloluteibacterium stylophorae TaxID=1776034 RepID=A0A8J7VWJ5_9GAMM|nr:poly-beta-1,6-N-acetyl-D-glucosamine biosynthesis protein PgaD [Coralloluteibacterium stylophorae]MBS7455687.1 poly-beta-1,6-N-acetyl-D-glucosamine biosynthesis protein PgaD [Coralloluteibacterium stylophorae]
MTPPLIERPRHLDRGRRALLGLLTALAWAVYVYLWLPLLTLLAWLLGVRTVYTRLYLEQSQLDAFLLLALPVIAGLCALVLIVWAEYNRVRFGGAERRRHRADVDDAAVAATLGATPALASGLRGARVSVLRLDDHGRPVRRSDR